MVTWHAASVKGAAAPTPMPRSSRSVAEATERVRRQGHTTRLRRAEPTRTRARASKTPPGAYEAACAGTNDAAFSLQEIDADGNKRNRPAADARRALRSAPAA